MDALTTNQTTTTIKMLNVATLFTWFSDPGCNIVHGRILQSLFNLFSISLLNFIHIFFCGSKVTREFLQETSGREDKRIN
jgi:hypothetical protein|tara:strand:+ start:968 stop:1207 length:240 start_codon:yes stop_codon:yes gene_type:complete